MTFLFVWYNDSNAGYCTFQIILGDDPFFGGTAVPKMIFTLNKIEVNN